MLKLKHWYATLVGKNAYVFCTACLLLAGMFAPLFVYGEGSRDLYPKNDSQAKRSYLMARGGRSVISTVSAYDPYPSAGVMRVYAKEGERIYAGSSIVGMRAKTSSGNTYSERGDIVLISPKGQIYRLSTLHNITVARGSRVGLIENFAEEQAGPVGEGSYLPFTVDVQSGQEGIWEVHFLALGDGGTNIPNPQATPPGSVVNEVDGITIPDNYNFNRKANEDWIQPVYSGTDTKILRPLSLLPGMYRSVLKKIPAS